MNAELVISSKSYSNPEWGLGINTMGEMKNPSYVLSYSLDSSPDQSRGFLDRDQNDEALNSPVFYSPLMMTLT